MSDYTLKIKDVCALVGLKPWAIYNNIRRNGFPKPSKINARVVRWSEAEIKAWIEARKS